MYFLVLSSLNKWYICDEGYFGMYDGDVCYFFIVGIEYSVL